MSPRSRSYHEWSPRQPSGTKRFLPVAGTFSDGSANVTRLPAVDDGPIYAGHSLAPQFSSQQQQFFLPPQIPFNVTEFQQLQIAPPTATYQDALDSPPIERGPLVHEGFIPAPDHDYDEESYPTFPDDNPFFRPDIQFSSEDDSEEERILQEVAEKDDSEVDEDYSVSEDPEELLTDGDLDDDADEERTLKRGRPRSRPTRGGQRGRPSTRGRGGLRGATTTSKRRTGKRGKPKGPTGPRAVADPGPEFRKLQRLANEAFMREDFVTAKSYAQEAVQKNPEIFSAHNTLSEANAAMGDEQGAIWALMVGAPTKRDRELWWLLMERVQNVDTERYPIFNEEYKTAVCITCLKEIIKLNPKDYAARGRKLELNAQEGKIGTCVKLCRQMLKIQPHEYDALKQMAILGTSTPKHTRLHLTDIIQSFDFSISYFIAHDEPLGSTLDWSLLNIYLDLLDRAGDYNRALSRLKFLCRWKQQRQGETYWDDENDDREFDVEDVPRRITVPGFERKRKAKYGESLPFEFRVKMGLFRLRQTPPDFVEAMHHLNMLEPDDEGPDALLRDYPDLFRLAADALHAAGYDKEAVRFYEPVLTHFRDELVLKSFIGLHTCYKHLEETENAEKIIPTLRQWNAATLDDLTVLAKFFEDNDMQDEAMLRAEIVFRNKGAPRLRKVGFQGYPELRLHFQTVRKQEWDKRRLRKVRSKKYKKSLRIPPSLSFEQDSEDDHATGERPSLGLLGKRPAQGLFRAKGRSADDKRKKFVPVEPITLEGTNVPLADFDHQGFQRKMDDLAKDYKEELIAARAQHREIVTSFGRLDELHEPADEGDEASSEEYMTIARELIEEFSTFDLFYSSRRDAFGGYFRRLGSGEIWKESALMALAVKANDTDDGEEGHEPKEKPDVVPQHFYGVHFDRWADTFGRYALLLARNGDSDRCFMVIDAALRSNIFYRSSGYSLQLQLCRLACAIRVDDSHQASSALRWLLKVYPFGTELFRLYNATHRLCPIAEGYATGHSHKAFLRYIKTIDYVLLRPDQRLWFNFRGDDRAQWLQQAISSNTIKHVKNHDPALFALFGNVLMCSASYVGALNYYFRAYAITPNDPTLVLSIGLAYIQHAMKRLSENRQYQIQQGLAFVNRYYELRARGGAAAIHLSEAEYNVARVWHTLGLTTQAVTAYERCIALSDRVKKEAHESAIDHCREEVGAPEDFAAEAAFALQAIYTQSGDLNAAYKVTQEALIID